MVLAKPVVGVSALLALADAVWHDMPAVRHVVTWTNAQRGEVFAASFARDPTPPAGVTERTPAFVANPAAALDALARHQHEPAVFAGDSALTYRDLIVSAWGSQARVWDHVPALAPAVARVGQQLALRGAAGPPHALQPVYVRRSDAELDRERQAEA
jgi:tRNA A37 threonylcarbamoyladenosine modification protein TsaB